MLGEALAACYFDGVPAPSVFEVGLSSGDRRRVVRWDRVEGQRSVTVTFGFPDGGSFGWAALFADGVEVPGTRAVVEARVPPGGEFVYTRTFGLADG